MNDRAPFGIQQIIEGTALVGAVTLLAHLATGHLGVANLALFFLLPVIAQSGRSGLRAGLYTSVIAALAFNFFLIPPRYTLHIAETDNLVTMVVLFAVALAVSKLASRMRQQAALAERLAGDRQREAFREALLSSISHDLKTPITAIRTGIETLAHDPGERHALETVRAETARLERMVTNLLEMTRIEAGAIPTAADIIDLTDTISAAIEALPAEQRREIAISIPPDLPLVRADARMLHHMLLNLVENAMRHGNGRDVDVSVASDGSELVVTVADRGPGIAIGREDDIFKRFDRASHDAAGHNGSGLGLAIVRGFGNAMRLTTAAANRDDGPGARFTIRIPEKLLVASGQVRAE